MTTAIAHELQTRTFVLQDRLNDLRGDDRYDYEMAQTLDELMAIEEQLEALDLDMCARDDRWEEEVEANR